MEPPAQAELMKSGTRQHGRPRSRPRGRRRVPPRWQGLPGRSAAPWAPAACWAAPGL